jgi:hypothetical protein
MFNFLIVLITLIDILILSDSASVPPTFSDTNSFSAGTVRTISTLASSNTIIANMNITFSNALSPNYVDFHAFSSVSSF